MIGARLLWTKLAAYFARLGRARQLFRFVVLANDKFPLLVYEFLILWCDIRDKFVWDHIEIAVHISIVHLVEIKAVLFANVGCEVANTGAVGYSALAS